MKEEFIIINKSVLEKRIEELKKPIVYYDGIYVSDSQNAQIELIEELLSQSTALIPEIEKAFDKGVCAIQENNSKLKVKMPKAKQDYISNLKLDI